MHQLSVHSNAVAAGSNSDLTTSVPKVDLYVYVH